MNEITLLKGQKVSATVSAFDVNGNPATVSNIIWQVSDPSIIDIVDNSGVATLLTKGVEGSCTLTVLASGKDGAVLEATATVIVAEAPSQAVSIGIIFGTPETI
jgi:hypothetical protein